MLAVRKRPALLRPRVGGRIDLAPVVARRAIARNGNEAKRDRIAHARTAKGCDHVVAYAGEAIGIGDRRSTVRSAFEPRTEFADHGSHALADLSGDRAFCVFRDGGRGAGDEIKSGAGALQRRTKSLCQTYLLYMSMKFPPCACHKSGALRTRNVPASSCTYKPQNLPRYRGYHGHPRSRRRAQGKRPRDRSDARPAVERPSAADLTRRPWGSAVFQCGRKHGLSAAAGAAFALRLCCALVENASCCTANNKTKPQPIRPRSRLYAPGSVS
jgi:hypothetical protein